MASSDWCWGASQDFENIKVFESMEVLGGYLCKFCGLKLKKRWDCLTGHIAKCKKKPNDMDAGILDEIPRIKVKCKFCSVPLDMTGAKEARHYKTCKDFKIGNGEVKNGLQKDNKRNNNKTINNNNVVEGADSVPLVAVGVDLHKEKVLVRDTMMTMDQAVSKRGEHTKDIALDIKAQLNGAFAKVDQLSADWNTKENMYLEQIQLMKVKNEQLQADLSKSEDRTKRYKEKSHNLEKELRKKEKCKQEMETKLMELVRKKDDLLKEASKVEWIDFRKLKMIRVLGEGSYGKVSEAEYKGNRIAVKEMKNHYTSIHEMSILLKIVNSPNLLTTNLIGVHWPSLKESTIMVGLELCSHDLRSILPMDPKEKSKIVMIMVGAAQSLVQLSNLKILHLDIKPENFLLQKDTVKLGDFGLAQLGEEGYGTHGTPGYVAPEVILSDIHKTSYDRKADMWSLGATIYEMLTGVYLVSNTNNRAVCLSPPQKWNKVDESLRECAEISKNLLVKDPKDRMSSSEFLSKVQKVK